MQYINKLILGTVQLGLDYGINNAVGKPSTEKAISILNAAFEKGISYLDTAEAYGTAQDIVGLYHQHYSNKFKVITKLKSGISFSNELDFRNYFLRNFQVLNVAKEYAYLFHNFETYKSFSHWKGLHKLKQEGYIEKIGVSIYTNEQALEVAEDERIDIVQMPFNLLDNYSLRKQALTALKDKGKEVHIRSVFLQGLFYKDRQHLGSLAQLKESLNQIDLLALEGDISIGSLALGYCLRQPMIDRVIIGVETQAQLLDNLVMLAEADKIDGSIVKRIDDIRVINTNLLNPTNWK